LSKLVRTMMMIKVMFVMIREMARTSSRSPGVMTTYSVAVNPEKFLEDSKFLSCVILMMSSTI